MIDTSVLPTFLTAIFFLIISPGPDLVLLSAYSAAKGFKFGLIFSIGVFTAGVIETLVVAFGLGSLVNANMLLGSVIKAFGAMYLAWLGLNMILPLLKRKVINMPLDGPEIPTDGFSKLFFAGLLNNVLNPKVLVFFGVFLPQFVTERASPIAQMLMLGFTLCFVALIANIIFAQVFARLGKIFIPNPKVSLIINATLGLIFVLLAIKLFLM